ncbi:MAG TPA: DUF697 domain-containing protein [Anaerohalosphaeraceae bacterium]|nr:DUF697 domain-containing protein [Anaerohalosphaeraceae bacterium]HOL32045.1 DUF697 domain-containing protein [Anaerohalosphaeraceae bacterium]HOM76271.1 DUF697 domain-containing protein [Anaerohalosphaeraceae bacterium]HPC64318.1 DUF697 domain-containing protein [Anaerohalosphaeraceae bacterium]HPO70502.1 DUF697 domain-containing protein [Anaerohalosphaeraceae bacterium]
MLKTVWNLIRTGVIVVGVLLSFFAVLEVLRTYQTLHAFHPWAGGLFLAAAVGLVIWLAVYVWINLAAFPPALNPPRIEDFAKASQHQLKQHLRYLRRFLQRLQENPGISEDKRGLIGTALDRISQTLSAPSSAEAMRMAIEAVQADAVKPILSDLDELAARQVRDSMRDIMIGVTLSPYKSADLLIVLYRNLVMVMRIVRIYRTRPALSELLGIFSDIVNVIATVNYINMGKNLIEGLGSRVPGIGRFVDDIAQGIGAGFMTTITGHAAIDRCRSFREWNAAEAKRHLLSHVGDFYNDVKDIFFKDVWGGIRSRIGAAGDNKDKVADALNETGSLLDSFIRVPAKAVGAAGQAVAGTTNKGFELVGRKIIKAGTALTKPFRKTKPTL